jgi:C-terminal processing protease CtpA/Prc
MAGGLVPDWLHQLGSVLGTQKEGELPKEDDSGTRHAMVGVGMGLSMREDGALQVTDIVPDGPVHRTSQVQLGDVLQAVDGRAVGKNISVRLS